MTTGMMAGRGFFPPGKGGRRGFPIIGEEFGYFGPHDKPPFPHDFGYPPNFPPPPDGFFPGPMGFMGKFYTSSKSSRWSKAACSSLRECHTLLKNTIHFRNEISFKLEY